MNENQNGNLVETTNGASTYIITAIISFAIGFGSAWLIYNKKTATVSDKKLVTTTEIQDTTVGTDESVKIDNSNIIKGAKIEIVPATKSTIKPSTVTIIPIPSINSAIVVSNQVAGKEVNVGKITISKPAWVAITDVYEDGSTGYILGAKLFDVGTNFGVVELLRGTVAGKTYAAIIREDNGDESFDPKLDLPLKDSSGSIVLTKFKAN